MEWTFGICTDANNSLVGRVLDSIKELKIPTYEILLAADEGRETPLTKQEATIFCPVKPQAWITKKKNDLIKAAKYNNVCLVHDYVAFHSDWYVGYERFNAENPNWTVCSNQTRNMSPYGGRLADWILTPLYKEHLGFGLLPYNVKHLSKYMFVSGMYYCVRKDFIIANNLWLDESMFWGSSEDQEWSARARKITDFSFNEHSTNFSLKEKNFCLRIFNENEL